MRARHDFVPVPETGRRYHASRKVRLGDADGSGRLRLDALARYLQDVANDDALDAGLAGAMSWVVRRLAVQLLAPVGFGDVVDLVTFCGSIGSRFAERRTSVFVGGRAAIEVSALWVFFDPDTGRPARLGEQFHAIYGEAARGRTASSRLSHGAPPPGAARRPWPQRVTDVDLLGHANNAIALAAVEEAFGLPSDGAAGPPAFVEVEYRDAIEPVEAVELITGPGAMWLTVGGQVRVSAVVGGPAAGG